MASEACHVGRSVANKTLPAYALAVTLKVVGDPTLIRLDRALCLVRQNEIDAGCQLATDTFASLPPEHHASIFFGYGKKVLAAVPREHANRHAVSLYRAAMAESRQAIAAM